MTEPNEPKRIFISACEPSADAHCANLIKAVKQMGESAPEIQWVGVGGEKMAQAGCELLENPSKRAVMLYNAFAHLKYYRQLIKRISQYLQDSPVDMVIVCDSPSFNFHIAAAGKRNGAKVMFYVAPQLWAWAAWRIKKLRRLCDKLACILPFEAEWFKERGVDTTFVGNPLFDDLGIDIETSRKDYTDFELGGATIALMPGSRDTEIKKLWPAMQKIAVRLKKKWSGITFITPAVDDEKLTMLKDMQDNELQIEYSIGDVGPLAKRADLTLVTSGSATLQVAAAGCPMVIMYQSSKILWNLVGRWLIKTRFLSLVNILAGRQLVPEFMPYFSSTQPIYQRCKSLLYNKSKLGKTSRELVAMVRPLATGNASKETAKLAIELLEKN